MNSTSHIVKVRWSVSIESPIQMVFRNILNLIYSWARDKTKPDINHHIDGINILNITKAESDEICQRISDLKGSIEGFIGQKIHIYQFEDEGEFIFIGTRRLGGFSNSEYSKFCDTKEY